MSTTLFELVSAARATVREVGPADAAKALNGAHIELILDVREPDEYRERHLPDAINIPRGLLEIRADPASPACDPMLTGDRSRRILVYCTRGPGARSLLSAQTLKSMGYEHVDVLGGGLLAWAEAGLPVDGEPQPANA